MTDYLKTNLLHELPPRPATMKDLRSRCCGAPLVVAELGPTLLLCDRCRVVVCESAVPVPSIFQPTQADYSSVALLMKKLGGVAKVGTLEHLVADQLFPDGNVLHVSREVWDDFMAQANRTGEVLVRCLRRARVKAEAWRQMTPIDMELFCPECGKQHLDAGEFTTRVHRKHLCENTPEGPRTGCGHLWQPFQEPTRGVLKVERA